MKWVCELELNQCDSKNPQTDAQQPAAVEAAEVKVSQEVNQNQK